MSEPRHTPGPWMPQYDPRSNYTDIVTDAPHEPGRYELVASVTHDGGSDVVAEANARLIAAAPDLADFAGMVIDEAAWQEYARNGGELGYVAWIQQEARKVLRKLREAGVR